MSTPSSTRRASTRPTRTVATEYFTTATRNLHEFGERAGVRHIVAISIVGCDRFSGGYNAAKVAQEQSLLAGPIPASILRAAQFHEFVAQLADWGRQGDVSYVPKMQTQLVAASAVAAEVAKIATAPAPADNAPITEIAGPRVENLAEMASLLAERTGVPARVEELAESDDPDAVLYATDGVLPGQDAMLAGPTYAEWLEASIGDTVSTSDSGSTATEASAELRGCVSADHRDDRHPRGEPGLDPRRGVLDHEAALRRDPEPLRPEQVAVGVGLADGDVIGGDQRRGRVDGQRLHPRDGRALEGRGDDGAALGRDAPVELERALDRNAAVVDAQDLVLDPARLLDRIAVRRELADDLLGPPPVDDRHQLRVIDPVALGEALPGDLDPAGRVDEDAVHVEEDRLGLRHLRLSGR